jgi:hypothetical protein
LYIFTQHMSEFEKKTLELELKAFASKNFERPADCKNLDQVRFYIRELCVRIEDYQNRFNYAPELAYTLLAQYNARQNSMLYKTFVNS